MENYVYKLISISGILEESQYCLRYRPQNKSLERSVTKRGVINPIWVTSGVQATLVAGHRRVAAAKEAGLKQIGAFEIQGKHTPRDLFLLSLFSNWSQNWSDLDCAWALRKAIEVHSFDEATVRQELMPALGLCSEKYLLEQLLSVARLHPSLLELIADEKLPFRGASVLTKFQCEDQKTFCLSHCGKGWFDNESTAPCWRLAL